MCTEKPLARRRNVTVQPERLFPIKLSRLLDHEVRELSCFLSPIQIGEEYWSVVRQQNEQLLLPRAFISLEALFGSTSTRYDSHKGSFAFPLLLTATRCEKLLRYSVVVNDLRGALRVRLSRLGEEPTPKFAPLIPPVDHELSRHDLDYLTEFIIGFLLGYSQVAVKAAGSFHRVVPSELLIYGSLDGDLFEKTFKDERAFDRGIRETEAKLRDLETGRRRARVEALLDAVERGGLWHP